MTPRQVLYLLPLVTLFWTPLHAAPETALPLTLEDYVQRAIQKGVQGRENALTFESAGYTREIAFRQTDSPSLSATASGTRDETRTSGSSSTPNGTNRTDDAQGGLSLTELLPTGTNISAQGTTTPTRTSGLGTTSEFTKNNFTASVSQPIYLFVKNSVLRTRHRAELTFETARDTLDTSMLSLRSKARNLYYQVLLQEQSIQVADRQVMSSRKLLDITQALVHAGKSAAVDTMRSKLRVQDNERVLANAQTNYDKAVINAKNLIFLPLDQPVRFSSRLELKPVYASLDRLIAYAMLHNPQLRSLHHARELADLDLQAAQETTRPTLSLNSTYNYTETSPVITRGLTLGGTMNWLFFDSFITRDNVSKARIGVIVADLNLIDGERTTQLNVHNIYLDVKNAEKQLADYSASLDQARHNVEVIRLRLKNGLDRLIDVFNAEDELQTLENQYLNQLVTFNQLKDALSEQLGTDVETVP